MPYKREDSVTLPPDRYGGVVNHVGNDVPIVLSSVAGCTAVKAVMSGSQGQQDRPLSVLGAHFGMILAQISSSRHRSFFLLMGVQAGEPGYASRMTVPASLRATLSVHSVS